MINVRAFRQFIPLWFMSLLHGLMLFFSNDPSFLVYEHYGSMLRNEAFNIIYLMLVLIALGYVEKMFSSIYMQTRFKNHHVLFFEKEKIKMIVLVAFVFVHQLPFIIYCLIYKINSLYELCHLVSSLMFLYALSIVFDKLGHMKSKQVKMIVCIILFTNIFQFSSLCLEGMMYTAYYESEMMMFYTLVFIIMVIYYYASQFMTYWPFRKYHFMPLLLGSMLYWLVKTRIYYVEASSMSDYMEEFLFRLAIDGKVIMMFFVTFIATWMVIYLKSMAIDEFFEENKLYLMLRFKNEKQFTYTKLLNSYALALLVLGLYLLPLYVLAIREIGSLSFIFSSSLIKKLIIYYLGLVLMINLRWSKVLVMVVSIGVIYLYQVLNLSIALNYLILILVVLNIILLKKVGMNRDNTSR